MTQVLACFDFDGTLTRGDSLLPFLHAACGAPGLTWALVRSMPALVGYGIGRVRNDVAKQRLLACALGGQALASLTQQGRLFAEQRLPRLLRPEALERLRWHKQQGHRCVLISASPALYLQPWSDAMGFTACLATELEVDGTQRLTGRFAGANCHGEEKVRRLLAWQASQAEAGECRYAYGDTAGDLPLLRHARFGHWVDADPHWPAPDEPAPWPVRHSRL